MPFAQAGSNNGWLAHQFSGRTRITVVQCRPWRVSGDRLRTVQQPPPNSKNEYLGTCSSYHMLHPLFGMCTVPLLKL